MNHSTVLRLIKQRCKDTTQAAVAKSLDVSPAYLSDVLAGRREPGPKLLRALGLERRTVYEPTNGS